MTAYVLTSFVRNNINHCVIKMKNDGMFMQTRRGCLCRFEKIHLKNVSLFEKVKISQYCLIY